MHPAVTETHSALNETDEEITIHTPVGNQVAVRRKTPTSWYCITLKWQVETEAELRVATWREENTTWEWDARRYAQLQQEVGDLGAPTMYMPRMNVQSLYIEKMGVEKAESLHQPLYLRELARFQKTDFGIQSLDSIELRRASQILRQKC